MCQINIFNNLGGVPDINGYWVYYSGPSITSINILDESDATAFTVSLAPDGITHIVPDTISGNGRHNLRLDFASMVTSSGNNHPGGHMVFKYYTLNWAEGVSCGDVALLTINDYTTPDLGSNVTHDVCVNPSTNGFNMFNLLNTAVTDGAWTYDSINSTMVTIPVTVWLQNNYSDPTDDEFDPNGSGLVVPGVYIFNYTKVISIPGTEVPDEGVCSECTEVVILTINVEAEPNPGTDTSTSICL
jgi:hypothetical protein